MNRRTRNFAADTKAIDKTRGKTCRQCPYCAQPVSAPQAKTCASPECKRQNRRKNEERYREKLKQQGYVASPASKICPGCQQDLLSSAYGKHRSRSDGLQTYCKSCRSEYAQRGDQKEQDAKRKADWYQSHRDETLLANRKRYREQREEYRRKNHAAYTALTPEQKKERQYAATLRRQAQKHSVRRICPCGRGYWVLPKDNRRWFCSASCRLAIRWSVCETLVKAAKQIGVRLVP